MTICGWLLIARGCKSLDSGLRWFESSRPQSHPHHILDDKSDQITFELIRSLTRDFAKLRKFYAPWDAGGTVRKGVELSICGRHPKTGASRTRVAASYSDPKSANGPLMVHSLLQSDSSNDKTNHSMVIHMGLWRDSDGTI